MTPADWTEVGTELFLAELDRVSDCEFQLPTRLPGWTRGHVVAHVHYNAVALVSPGELGGDRSRESYVRVARATQS